MMIEGSGSGAGSGSIPLTSGSGSRRPKNMWIRWIRIRNTATNIRIQAARLEILGETFSLTECRLPGIMSRDKAVTRTAQALKKAYKVHHRRNMVAIS
jgi:hypothetical protein